MTTVDAPFRVSNDSLDIAGSKFFLTDGDKGYLPGEWYVKKAISAVFSASRNLGELEEGLRIVKDRLKPEHMSAYESFVDQSKSDPINQRFQDWRIANARRK